MTSVFHWLACCLAALPVSAGGVFWTDRGASQLKRMAFDGSALQTVSLSGAVVSPGSNVRGLAVDTLHNRLFWADNGSDTLLRANLDGTDSQVLVTITGGNAFPADVRPSVADGVFYWCDQIRNRIQRATLEGANVTDIIPDAAPSGPYFLDLDLAAQKLYWGDFSGGAIFRANLDGTARETLLTGNNQTRGVCVDPIGGRLYWINRDDQRIHRCPLSAFTNGTIALTHPAVETLYTGLDTPHGLVLDVPAGKLYWADTGSNAGAGFGERSVCRGDLDGRSSAEILATGNEPWDVDLDRRCTNYAEWRARFFRRDAPATQTAPSADPDGDGAPNVLEYAFGTPPMQADVGHRSHGLLVPDSVAGSLHPGLVFRRSRVATDLAVRVQVSVDLANWENDLNQPSTTEVTVLPLEDGLEEVTVRTVEPLPESAPRFLRLLVELKP